MIFEGLNSFFLMNRRSRSLIIVSRFLDALICLFETESPQANERIWHPNLQRTPEYWRLCSCPSIHDTPILYQGA